MKELIKILNISRILYNNTEEFMPIKKLIKNILFLTFYLFSDLREEATEIDRFLEEEYPL